MRNEILRSLEQEATPPHVYIFDVDGPIVDPKERIVTEIRVVDELVAMLERGDIVALNTGRSIEWLERGQKVNGVYPEGQMGLIGMLDERITDKRLLERFYCIGEKGSSELRYVNGEWVTTIDERISVPIHLQEMIRSIIMREYSEWMFYDDTKLTMITSEMNPVSENLPWEEKEAILHEFTNVQLDLLGRLNPLLEESGVNEEFIVDPTTIATDVEAKGVGKDFAALRIFKWMTDELALDPMKLYVDAIGDSGSDIPMAEALSDKVKSVRFVFVGNPEKAANKIALERVTVPLVVTKAKDGAGTIEFLESELHKRPRT